MSLLNKDSVKRVEKALNNFDSSLKITILDNSARTALDAASALNCEVGAIVKSLLFKASDIFILCLISGDKRCSLNKLKKILSITNVSMAPSWDLEISPAWGHLNSNLPSENRRFVLNITILLEEIN